MTADLAAQADELVERTCSEQGVPVVVTDDRTLDRVAGIVRSASSAPSRPGMASGGASSAEPEPTSPQGTGAAPPSRLGAVPSERRAS